MPCAAAPRRLGNAVGTLANLSLPRRIEALKARFAPGSPPPPMHPVAPLLNVPVAYHLGRARPSDNIGEATARGRGYGGPRDFTFMFPA